ncbi:transposase [Streptomyces sp. NRRL S-455]|uniref:transposase n=1 Tax=Streptomyces sp. NRRL S-455 TaxID=1463908 RepID=UPI000B2E6907
MAVPYRQPWRDVPDSYGSWSTIYDRFRMWARDAVFQTLMDATIAEAATRDDVDLNLASVDSTVVRARHHAAGMVVDPELLEDLEKAVAEEKGLQQRGQNDPVGEGSADMEDPERDQRRAVRRRRRARLRAAELGRSRGGLTSKVHIAVERRCRPLSIIL